ncbi:MAG TPA: isoaspartyl peptidase/L-asparaginase [Gemmataceae bacterium]|nr:isoaspartyl peptidase/L-asparaginase [Gemmataceae bacterium]
MWVGKRLFFLGIFLSLPTLAWLLADAEQAPPAEKPARKLVLVIHGGEGDLPEKVSPQLEKKQKEVLAEALRRGYARLKEGKKGASIDAVETAIRVMEDSPLFNAGKGAVFTHEGRNELDASIMDGKDKKAGAVAGVSIIKNPITAARAVMEHSPHVLLIGRGAELFAIKQKLDIVHPDYFWTEQRWKQLQDALKEEEKRRGRAGPHQRPESSGRAADAAPLAGRPRHFGTVGAVALDGDGNLAAGTSTGGMTNKWSGRVGDSPIIAAGTYADNEGCAVSCTGWGEYFIRYAVAHDICARVKYARRSVKEAAEAVIGEQLQKVGAEGGAIVLGPRGDFHMVYNRLAGQMSRGFICSDDGKPHVAILDKPLPKQK